MSPPSMLRRALTFTHLPKSVRLNGQRGRRPYANSAASAAEERNPDGNKVRGRRRSKKDLQALVETFVNEYRAMNAGRFPPFVYTQQQVGGSYYRVRGILQELQYRDKTSPSCGGIEHSLAREGVRGSEALTEDGVVSGRTVSEVENDTDLSVAGNEYLEAKEELQASSSVEILSKEVITPGRGSDLDVTHNIGKVKSEGSLKFHPDIVEMFRGSEISSNSHDKSGDSKMEEAHAESISKEKHLQGQGSDLDVTHNIGKVKSEESSFIDPDIVELRGFEISSHSHDKSQDSKLEEAQANNISKEKHLQIGDTNTATPCSDDTEDVTKLILDDSECKMKQHEEEIPQADRFDSTAAEKNIPQEADKTSEVLSGRPADDAEPPKPTTLWGAMKSFANGIISIFRQQ
ncbi:uncharacterized protein LOC126796306 [Argentina anserina]|uniref:uncharacterized protein LOC126796306 n=1 Tax=Argentina anserina TaxID=57926 RepID=UPI00217671A0|nr:uncharacterized protein LOC126796306 [Potentilla anserina]XP_050379059.1 uncharacterized protein LOC126796306 [Potentilla anserina]